MEGFVWARRGNVSPHDKRRNSMRRFEYVCRCGKRFESLFQQKQHAKYMCSEKHLHREELKTRRGLSDHRPRQQAKDNHEKEHRRSHAL